MTIEEAEQKKRDLMEEIKNLSKFISQEKTKENLSSLEYGKYYKCQNSNTITYFQYTESCKYNESELAGSSLTVDRYIEVILTRMYFTTSFGNHGIIFMGDNSSFEGITKEEFKEVFEDAITNCKRMIE